MRCRAAGPLPKTCQPPRCIWPNNSANHTSGPADLCGTNRAHGTYGPAVQSRGQIRGGADSHPQRVATDGEIGSRFGSGRNRGLSKLSVTANSVAVRPTCQCVPRAVHSTDKAQMGQARALVQGTFKGPQKASVHPNTEERRVFVPNKSPARSLAAKTSVISRQEETRTWREHTCSRRPRSRITGTRAPPYHI